MVIESDQLEHVKEALAPPLSHKTVIPRCITVNNAMRNLPRFGIGDFSHLQNPVRGDQ